MISESQLCFYFLEYCNLTDEYVFQNVLWNEKLTKSSVLEEFKLSQLHHKRHLNWFK